MRRAAMLLILRQMSPKILPTATWVILFLGGVHAIAAESLGETLRAANVPVQGFSEPELSRKITSYAISTGDPFLLAYYVDDGSGQLHAPLYVVRVDRETGNPRRADLPDIGALLQDGDRMECLGSALRISEHRGTVYIETHGGPSAGCIVVLSSVLSYRAALSGWLLGLVGSDYAIVRESEMHFLSVSPLHIAAYDLVRNRSVQVFPPEPDVFRQQYSRSIQPHISLKWCMENNAQCDPGNFDTEIPDRLVVNEEAKTFGFEARFDAGGFGPEAEQHVATRTVAYIFRERTGQWQHREFEPSQIPSRFGVLNIGDLVTRIPDKAFGDDVVK
jgi:hypothetical protein